MNDIKISRKEQRLQVRKEFKEYISIADKRVLDVKKSGIELIAKDEVFVLVRNTYNYWVSNNCRLVNNLRKNFFMHKTTTDKKNGCTHFILSGYDENGSLLKIDTYIDKLVAEHFLENPKGYKRIWHIDRDLNNNYYKNLVYVNNTEYVDLEREVITVDELGRKQEHTPYITLKSNVAYSIWNGIYNRCYKNSDSDYEDSTMCDNWKNDKDSMAEWYNSNYYECDGESMAVDKDLLFPGTKVYSPETCCILPQTLNTMISNCKKHRLPKWKKAKMNLPLGVRYDSGLKMYYAQIKLCNHDEVINLSYHKTAEEAFEEYKKFKEADIMIMALKYKNKIPDNVYKALLKYEVKPYVEDKED